MTCVICEYGTIVADMSLLSPFGHLNSYDGSIFVGVTSVGVKNRRKKNDESALKTACFVLSVIDVIDLSSDATCLNCGGT